MLHQFILFLTSKCKIKALRINVHYKTPAKEASDVRITSHVIYHEKLRSKVMQFEYCIITKLATDHFSLN